MNREVKNIFDRGFTHDLTNHATSNRSYKLGINGRLYSHNGTLAYTSIKGTEEIYNNPAIKKYLGYCRFDDELILFTKYDIAYDPNIVSITKSIRHIEDVSITYARSDADVNFIFDTPAFNLELGYPENTYTYNELVDPEPPEYISDDSYECYSQELSKYEQKFTWANPGVIPNFSTCEISLDDNKPENNDTYRDAIFSLKKDVDGYVIRLLWRGYLNFRNNAKIVAVGIDENIHYKRVYFTDNINPFRSFNIKDPALFWKKPKSFDLRKDVNILAPRVKEVTNGGSLKAMSVMYVCRYITSDGAVTSFSPASEMIQIYPDKKQGKTETGGIDPVIETSDPVDLNVGGITDDIQMGGGGFIPDIKVIDPSTWTNTGSNVSAGAIPNEVSGGDSAFRGGDIGERTNKKVNILVNSLNRDLYKYVECFAVEFEASDVPTSMRNLGMQKVDDSIIFTHTGQESDVDEITLIELLSSKSQWKYASSLAINKNKLIVGATRNDPYPIDIKSLEDDFLLKGWDSAGNTHDCLINPEPSLYKYVDPTNTQVYKKTKYVLYKQFKAFDDFTLRFTNTSTNYYIEKKFVSSGDFYEDYMEDVYNWLVAEADGTHFPNLKIGMTGGYLTFERLNTGTDTDLSDYQFSTKTRQILIEKEADYDFPVVTINDTSKLVHGAVSYGFNKGNGVRLSWTTKSAAILEKDYEVKKSGKPLALKKPSLIKGFMKGEIYRLGIQFYKNGEPLFVIPFGDIKTPELYEEKTYIDGGGSPVHTGAKHTNQFVIGDVMFTDNLLLKAEVRTSCEMKKFVDSYQIVYVERTEENRTILAQGFISPMQRIVKYGRIAQSGEDNIPEVFRKWTLPYMGGPLHEIRGFDTYTNKGESFDDIEDGSWTKAGDFNYQATDGTRHRIVTNRKLVYFDSPDFIYDKVSNDPAKNASLNIIARIKTDHDRAFLHRFRKDESYERSRRYNKKFSSILENTPQNITKSGSGFAIINDRNKNTNHSFIRFSVYSQMIPSNEVFQSADSATHKITHIKEAGNGLILPGSIFGLSHPVSNNALTIGYPDLFYSGTLRDGTYIKASNYEDEYMADYYRLANRSTGYRTMIIRTKDDIFTDELIGEERIFMNPVGNIDAKGGTIETTDTAAIANIYLNNENSVYGGRTKYALSQNQYIPLGDVINIDPSVNNAQITTVPGDTYTTLFIRARNTWHNAEELKEFDDVQAGSKGFATKHEIIAFNTPSAWVYAVVLQTTVEERLSYDTRPYRLDAPMKLDTLINESINPCYLVSGRLKTMIPRPYLFKDNPLFLTTLNASKVKLNGDFYDSFLNFPVNDFFDLERVNGIVNNLFVVRGELYALQDNALSKVTMDPYDVITTQGDAQVQIVNGTGKVFVRSQILLKYGTNIRRGVYADDDSYAFYDETRNAFIFNGKNISDELGISQYLNNEYKNDPVTNTEVYYDPEYKEYNIALETRSGKKDVLSYNKIERAFNGKLELFSNIYLPFENRILVPLSDNNESLHELNKGKYLNLLGKQSVMTIGFIVKDRKSLVQLFKGVLMELNIDYPVKEIRIHTERDANNIRVITGEHFRYFIREGVHTVPLRNINDRYALRGGWLYVEIDIESNDDDRIELFSVVTSIRDSQL